MHDLGRKRSWMRSAAGMGCAAGVAGMRSRAGDGSHPEFQGGGFLLTEP